jgi:hypothetical protein
MLLAILPLSNTVHPPPWSNLQKLHKIESHPKNAASGEWQEHINPDSGPFQLIHIDNTSSM